jgi:Rad3-related DNA helicase
LNKNKNFIVESSTGTGKTLSLLTSTLSWLDHALRIHDMIFLKKKTIRNNILGLERVKLTHVIYSSKSHSQLSQI